MIQRKTIRDSFKLFLSMIPFASWSTIRKLQKKLTETQEDLSRKQSELLSLQASCAEYERELTPLRIACAEHERELLLLRVVCAEQKQQLLTQNEPNAVRDDVFWYIQRLRKHLPFTRIEELSRDIEPGYLHSRAMQGCPVVYGHYHVLKQFAGVSPSHTIKANVDHTAYWDVEGPSSEANSTSPVICMAPKRAEYLVKNCNRVAYAVGPFIKYAEDMLSEAEYGKEKLRLGRTLLVFPSHSNLVVKNSYNIEEFVDYIQSVGKSYDTTRICIYHEDIINPVNRAALRTFFQLGCEIITAGSRFDLDYLSRLKSIIKLSDRVLTNSMGAYIGYAIALQKPVLYHYQEIQSSLSDNKTNWEADVVQTVKKEERLHQELSLRLNKLFKEDNDSIDAHQLAFIEDYWGISHLKTKEEMRQIIEDLERIIQHLPLSTF